LKRLIIVSNRLPFTITQNSENIGFKPSSGGLVSALSPYLEKANANNIFNCIWVGWPGSTINSEQQPHVTEHAMKQHSAFPIFLSEEEMDGFYHGFCNRTIWPLFHYFPSYAEYRESDWVTYQAVNQKFCDTLTDLLKPDDTVWIHDYQLLLLPQMLRKIFPSLRIGFFLHIPFPSYEIFRLLPFTWRKGLLEGMLGADLVGFHTQDYTQYFLRSVFRTLGLDHHLGKIQVGDQLRKADTFPIGIDYEYFSQASQTELVEQKVQKHWKRFEGQKIIFSVDRLDYSKGILNRLSGYEHFLESRPEWKGKIVFVLCVVPSRVDVPQYQKMKQGLDETVGKINGKFGQVDWVPILYSFRSLERDELMALYAAGDVALITPLRDGMNLVAKEYLACRKNGTGVLILSEMAGAARELGEALLVNPNHVGEIAETLSVALTMPQAEQIRRNRLMQERLLRFNSDWWARSFLSTLDLIKESQGRLATRYLGKHWVSKLGDSFRKANRRLLLLDYDGTLVPFADLPELAYPDKDLLSLITNLVALEKTTVYLISGRDHKTLSEWFEGIPLNIIAEHGAWIRDSRREWKTAKPMLADWKPHLKSIIEGYVDRLPGSFMEEKDYGLAWHFRGADAELGNERAKELMHDLISFTANYDVQVLEGKKVVEIRNSGINKGASAMQAVAEESPDFILAIGDDQTDEDMFRALPRQSATVRVGWPFSNARFTLHDWKEVRETLRELL